MDSVDPLGDKYENDWRYLVVTTFLVKSPDYRCYCCTKGSHTALSLIMLQTGAGPLQLSEGTPLKSRRDSVAGWYSQLCWG